MAETVGIRLKQAGKLDYFDPAGLDLQPGERVVVRTERGMEVGYIVVAHQQVVKSEVAQPLKPVIRKATPEDLRAQRCPDGVTADPAAALSEPKQLYE